MEISLYRCNLENNNLNVYIFFNVFVKYFWARENSQLVNKNQKKNRLSAWAVRLLCFSWALSYLDNDRCSNSFRTHIFYLTKVFNQHALEKNLPSFRFLAALKECFGGSLACFRRNFLSSVTNSIIIIIYKYLVNESILKSRRSYLPLLLPCNVSCLFSRKSKNCISRCHLKNSFNVVERT